MISTNPSLGFINLLLSFGISTCSYAPGTSELAMLRPLCASIISVQNNASKDTLGDETPSSSLSYSCLLPSAKVLPYIFPNIFSFITYTASNAFHLSSKDKLSGFIAVITGFLAWYLYTFS